MDKIKNAVVVGAGAIGAAFAAKIYDIEPDSITIFGDRDRVKKYKSLGFIINGRDYHFDYLAPEDIREPADLIIVAVKSKDLNNVVESIEPLVGENTIILSLLNGIDSEEIIGEKYGMDKILYSISVAIDAVREGKVINYSSIGFIHFGELKNKAYSEKVTLVKEFFDRVQIPYVIPEDMLQTIWWKFMINVGINQTSAVLRAPYKFFQQEMEGKEIMEGAMREVIALSQKVGANLTEDDLTSWYSILGKLGPENKTSMLQDMEASRKTEVDIFGGKVCKLGEKYGVATPVNYTLVKIIKALEKL